MPDDTNTDITGDLHRWLRQATDEDLKVLLARAVGRVFEGDRFGADHLPHDEPVFAVEFDYMCLIEREIGRRNRVLISLESDLMGGHRVWVSEGEVVDTFAAYCQPYPETEGCWVGDDRQTVGEALEDGRKHHPGYEPMLLL